LGQLWDIQDALTIGIYIELLEMRCMDPGNEVFHVLDETLKVEASESWENNGRRGISTRQFWG